MTYAETLKAAEKSGKIEDLTYQPVKFEKKGDQLVGELVDIQPTTFQDDKKPVNKYILQTDGGLKSAVLGAMGDSQLDGRVETGDILVITFQEKKSLAGGHTMNIFNIQRIKKEVEIGKETNDKTAVN